METHACFSPKMHSDGELQDILKTNLESRKTESQEYVNPAITGIFYFARIAWAVECQVKWIPEADCYDSWVKGFIQKIIRANPEIGREA